MTALAAARATKMFTASEMELPATAATVYHGGLACFDTSTGRVVKGQASATLIPIGKFHYPTEQAHTVANNGDLVRVKLFREIKCQWFVNATAGDAVVAANVGGLAYILDDQTVANNDATNTRSVLGRIWKLDSILGVLVEPIYDSSAHVSGLDV